MPKPNLLAARGKPGKPDDLRALGPIDQALNVAAAGAVRACLFRTDSFHDAPFAAVRLSDVNYGDRPGVSQ